MHSDSNKLNPESQDDPNIEQLDFNATEYPEGVSEAEKQVLDKIKELAGLLNQVDAEAIIVAQSDDWQGVISTSATYENSRMSVIAKAIKHAIKRLF